MLNLNIPNFILTLATGLTLLGMISIVIGIIILVSRSIGKDIQTIANQTTSMAEKGIAEDVSGLVGNASVLLNSLESLIKTTSGIGIFLIFLGILLIAGAYWMITQVAQFA
jgi:hypothetical protein